MRIVALQKAAAAGVLGALAWELSLRGALLAGIPTFDIVRALGTLVLPASPAALWWPVGLAAHAFVGVCWAVFYAYFFFGRFDWKPPAQGLVFSAIPAVLALLIAVPQLELMRMEANEVRLTVHTLLPDLSPLQIAGLLAGHAIFGLVIGSVYRRPVGYPVNRSTRGPLRRSRNHSEKTARRDRNHGFIFATGIECSYPTTNKGKWRRDEMAEAHHYRLWERDFELSREIGVTHLRYGPPLHLVFAGPGQYRWDLIDEPMAELEANGPEPIIDLCHFGLPDWLGNFQNREIVPALSDYARAFAERYPFVRFYTPVNEMYVCARMSAFDGLWNEARSDEHSFMTAAFNLAGASVAMTDTILALRPDAVFINSESSEFYQCCCPDPDIVERSALENERRFLPLDLLYGREVGNRMLKCVRRHGREEEYRSFLARKGPRRSVLGVDYYEWNEKLIDGDGRVRALGELFGWYVIALQYWDRYQRTMMHTETNRIDASDAPRWLWRQWHNVQLLRSHGVPLVGFTWYSLTDQIDWGTALARTSGRVDPVGLFDLNREVRTVGLAYKHLIDMHRNEPEYRECPALRDLFD